MLSGYLQWNELSHADDWFVFPRKIERRICIDEMVISEYIIIGEFYQFNLSSCIRQQNSLTAQFVSFSLSNLANIFYPPNFYNN